MLCLLTFPVVSNFWSPELSDNTHRAIALSNTFVHVRTRQNIFYLRITLISESFDLIVKKDKICSTNLAFLNKKILNSFLKAFIFWHKVEIFSKHDSALSLIMSFKNISKMFQFCSDKGPFPQ